MSGTLWACCCVVVGGRQGKVNRAPGCHGSVLPLHACVMHMAVPAVKVPGQQLVSNASPPCFSSAGAQRQAGG